MTDLDRAAQLKIVAETEAHLKAALKGVPRKLLLWTPIERRQKEGLTPPAAAEHAMSALGDPRNLARQLVAERAWGRTRMLLPLALLLGLVMALIDNQPTWDDTGVSAFAIVCATGLLSLFEPTRPWLWALVIGGWFPLLAIALYGNYGALLALLVAFGASYAGSFVRRSQAS